MFLSELQDLFVCFDRTRQFLLINNERTLSDELIIANLGYIIDQTFLNDLNGIHDGHSEEITTEYGRCFLTLQCASRASLDELIYVVCLSDSVLLTSGFDEEPADFVAELNGLEGAGFSEVSSCGIVFSEYIVDYINVFIVPCKQSVFHTNDLLDMFLRSFLG